MANKLSLLYVGSSEVRRRAIEKSLHAHGYEVEFERASDWQGMRRRQAYRHDFIMVDEFTKAFADEEAAGTFRLLVLEGRSEDKDAIVHPLHVKNIGELPALLERIRERSGARASTGNQPVSQQQTLDMTDLLAMLPGVMYRCSSMRGGLTEYVNGRVQQLTGYPAMHFLFQSSRRLQMLVHPADRRLVLNAIRRALQEDGSYTLEHRIVCANGSERWLLNTGLVSRQAGSELATIQGFAADVTERKIYEDRLSFLASHDSLTDLANRGLFVRQMQNGIKRAMRHHGMLACLFIDIDRFKRINDAYGHEVGDELLRHVASRLRRCIRGNDLIGRLGGDEFTILVDDMSRPMDAALVASKVLTELSKPFEIESRRLQMSASIGISCFPHDAQTADELLALADAAMYRMKRTGRHGFQFFANEFSTQHRENQLRFREIERDLRNGSFSLSFEPRVNLSSNRVVAVEAGLRASGNIAGRLATHDLIHEVIGAEKLRQLYSWLLGSLSGLQQQWSQRGFSGLRMVLPVGRDPRSTFAIGDALEHAVQASGFDPAELVLDFDEAFLLGAPVATTNLLRRLKSLGCITGVAGIGILHTSLELIGGLPIDYLTIDSKVIGDIPGDRNGITLAGALIGLAKRLNLKLAARDVATEAQTVFLRSNDCDEAQGPLFSAKLSAGEMGRLLERKLH